MKKELIRLKVNDITSNELRIDFTNAFFNGQGRNHLMAPVDKGYFELDKESGKLIYCFSMLRMFLIASGMILFIGAMSRSWLFLLIGFLWIFGVNWIINLIRQNLFMNRLKKMLLKLDKEHN